VAAFEILKSTLRTREYVQKGEGEGKTLLDAMRDGSTEGMQYFDAEIEKLIRTGIIDIATGLSYATNPGNMQLQIADLMEEQVTDNKKLERLQTPATAKKESSHAMDPEFEPA
jgi:twitching motility protein PilT